MAKPWENRDFVLKAVFENGEALEHAAEHLKADRGVVLAAMGRSWGSALKYASASLRQDRDFVLEAVSICGTALEHAPEHLKADREVALKAIEEETCLGRALQYAAESLRQDRDFVLKAVSSHGVALEHAAEHVKADREVVLKAIEDESWFGQALRSAAGPLRQDREFVLEAVSRNGMALAHAAEHLKADKQVVLKAMHADGWAFSRASEALKGDWEVALKAIKAFPDLYSCLNGRALASDKEGLYQAIAEGWRPLLSESLRCACSCDDNIWLQMLAHHDIAQILEDLCRSVARRIEFFGMRESEDFCALLEVLQEKLQDEGFVQRALLKRPPGGFQQFLACTPFSHQIPMELSSISGRTRTLLLFKPSSTAGHVKSKALQELGLHGHDPQFLDLVYKTNIVDTNARLDAWVEADGVDIPFCNIVQHWGCILRANGLLLSDAPDDYKADTGLVLQAVQQNGLALKFASEELRSHFEIVLEAVRQSFHAEQYIISEDLRGEVIDRVLQEELMRHEG